MPPKKQVVDLPVVGVIDLNDEAPMKQKKSKKVKEVMEVVVGVIDLNDEAPMKQKKSKKVKEVMEVVVEMPVVEAVVEKVKKPRKVKSPVPEELELNRNYEEPKKETKPKAGNAWIAHIKAFAEQNGMTYNKAMLDPRLKETYIKSTKGKVTLG